MRRSTATAYPSDSTSGPAPSAEERPRADVPRRARREPAAAQVHVALGVTSAWSLDVGRRPVRIAILEGEVMITFEGDPVDHVVAQGGAFTTPVRGRVAVAAFRPSRFGVTPA